MKNIGSRIQVVGPSCAGKSTLAEALAATIGAPFVELDALFWQPNWQEPDADEFLAKVVEATSGERWVVAGNYIGRTQPVLWPRLETIVWLDFSNRVVLPRVISRSWRRSRRRELLWGTNTEKFWPQLKIWNPKDSLIGYNLRRGKLLEPRLQAAMQDPALAHIHWVRLRSPREVERWLGNG